MDNMQTQIDHNAYSALFADSEESEAGELGLRKKIKRGGSTVIWKWKWGYKSTPENDFPIEI